MNDEIVDVIVCGFGGAGACAAIEAHDRGARVLVLERFDGGGATKRSGGVIYAGAGTKTQTLAGVADSQEPMLAYLREETGGAVSEDALREFCAESPEHMRWLESLGVEFEPRVFEPKTTQPPIGYGLYHSGNERQYAASTGAAPAPRGHVPKGRGMTGHVLFAALERAVTERGIEVRRRTQALELLREGDAVVGVVTLELPDTELARRAHATLTRAAFTSVAARRALADFERHIGRERVVRARRGVVLATGGFVFNPEMMRRYAPEYAGCMPLGTPGDDGRGIVLGISAGAEVRHMDRCAASRFFAPPEAFTKGILVDERGERICDESLYGATLSAKIAERGGRAFLILDQTLIDEAASEMRHEERVFGRPLAEVMAGEVNHLIFRKYCALVNARVNRRRAGSVAALARACGVPAETLERSVRAYNEVADRGGPDAHGKADELLRPLVRPPFYAVRCNLDSRLFPAPCITLGGLGVDERTGAVVDAEGCSIEGLYAAGRAAAGVASRSYVSGLSLADCIHSGRRAGRAAAPR
jgi:3-oxo-5alpha-steroid 4-dehydrogenase